jgi:hypothetical protein
MPQKRIRDVHRFIYQVEKDISSWEEIEKPIFRGEPNVKDTPLLPKLYRKRPDGSRYNENYLVQEFRRMAPSVAAGLAPERKETDRWLFLMQHVGLPTRLLDWTEGSLIALYFALQNDKLVVWMLNWVELNKLSTGGEISDEMSPLTWFNPPGHVNIGNANIKAAWERGETPLELPAAIKPTYFHQRMNAQKSWFTAHGSRGEPITDLVPSKLLKKYVIKPSRRVKMLSDLARLGITKSNLFPDLDALARELEEVG